MIKTAVLYCYKSSGRTRHIATAMQEGFVRHGIRTRLITKGTEIRGDIAVAYGWNHEPVFSRYKQEGLPFLYFDLGYWNRRPKGNGREGYHRLAVSSWCSSTGMISNCSADRFNNLNMPVKPWGGTHGGNILVTGMSIKAANTHGFSAGEWERNAIETVSSLSERNIVHRPKPVKGLTPCDPVESLLSQTHLLVTHHSNTAVDALTHGVPYYCAKGVAKRLSLSELTRETIENPVAVSDSDRLQLLSDIAYCQWTPDEMRTGRVWEHVRCILDSV